MRPFTVLSAIAAPLPWADVNTDDIFPAPGSAGSQLNLASLQDPDLLARNAFAGHRWDEDGHPDPCFVLNKQPYDRAQILVTGENFGCGSSREMAVWCLEAIGIRCVIAPSFGDIFYANCFKNGLLPVRLAQREVTTLTEIVTQRPSDEVTVDLTEQTVAAASDVGFSFTIDGYQRQQLLSGLDEIEATLHRLTTIEAHEAAYQKERPWLRRTTGRPV
jgi:3-isopropylmalate/(R)-2-methylmalate dehydratase small subunit